MAAAETNPPATAWFKSVRSAPDSNCVEIRHLADGHTEVRHSLDPEGLVLKFAAEEWAGLLEVVVMRPFPAAADWMLAQPDRRFGAQARYSEGDRVEFTHSDAESGKSLVFTTPEWGAFVGGVQDGQMAWQEPEPQALAGS